MATCISIMSKCPLNLTFLRPCLNVKHSFRISQYSSSNLIKKEDKPVKFTSSSAAKMSIAETTGLFEEKHENKIKKFVFLSSLGVFLLYFCVIREENDIDKILAGDPSAKTEELELIELRLKLSYCEKARLPTANIKARIEEIENHLRKPVFSK